MNGEQDFMKMMMGAHDSKCVWVNEFDTASVSRFYDKFMELERDESIQIIPVFIHSYGGEVYALTAMRDLMKSSHKPVATIAVGMAMSCGASLLAAGTKGFRFAAKDTQILIHQVSSVSLGKSSDIQESARATKDLNRKMFENLAQDCGKSVSDFDKEIKKRNNADWTLSAASAKRWGLIDHIGIPRSSGQTSSAILAQVTSYDDMLKDQETQKKR